VNHDLSWAHAVNPERQMTLVRRSIAVELFPVRFNQLAIFNFMPRI